MSELRMMTLDFALANSKAKILANSILQKSQRFDGKQFTAVRLNLYSPDNV
jgi:hypothetical protein